MVKRNVKNIHLKKERFLFMKHIYKKVERNMKTLKLKETLKNLKIQQFDNAVEQVIKKLREYTPATETEIALTIFKIHLMEKSEKKRVEILLNAFEKYAAKWNATKVIAEIKKQRENLK